MTWQDRDAAPFGQGVWDEIDRVARAAADEVRAARRLLEMIGPLGFAARAGVADDEPVTEDIAGAQVHLHVPRVQHMPVLHRTFSLGARAIAAREERGEPLDLSEVAEAGRQLGRAEDALLFSGNADVGVRGLLGQEGAIDIQAGDWSDPARAADDLLATLSRLDAAGLHGPFAVGLSSARYYALFRPHPGTSLTPHAQLQSAFVSGIVKAPSLQDTAIVVTRTPSGPRAVIGQEIAAAYDGREGIFHRISLVESVTLLPGVAGSVAILRGPRG